METCEYKTKIIDEMIRDRLVVSMRDVVLSEHLQTDPDLTLEKAKKALRQKEAVKDQSHQLQSSKVSAMDAMTVY